MLDKSLDVFVDEFYWEDRPRYDAALDAVRRRGEDLTGWIENAAESLQLTLERVWTRVWKLTAQPGRKKLVLRRKQEQLLQLLRDHKYTLQLRPGRPDALIAAQTFQPLR